MPESPLLTLPGAVRAGEPDAGVAAHYGEPVREQRRLTSGEALVDLSSRGVLRLTGEDRLDWLDSLTSQRVRDLRPGDSAESLLLDPAGRVEHAMAVVDDGAATWLVVEAASAAPLAAFLDRMRFMKRVVVEDVTADVAVVGALSEPHLPGPEGPSLVWRDPWATGAEGGVTRAATADHPGEAFPLRLALVPRAALPGLPGPFAGVDALEALRIAAWRPRAALEVDARTLPHELDWLRSAVHLAKGCYRGQETVAKVHNLGRPPRRLVQLDLDGSAGVLPVPGAPVLSGEDEVGTVTSSARHHEDGPIALAVVKRSLPEDAVLTVHADGEAVSAAQRTVVPAGAGPAVAVPRLPRLGAVQRR
ncbi:YgfZ/GcvT domain-containing protein [Amnibacterium endophyticum]|uniref:YgfZ/GcvT domain-containing protein n=1 Tax=Amnibacterium endophyticum TaxID=2109337 RepID=A0ABW4LDN6_9MICO